MCCKRRSNIVSSDVNDIKNWTTEERVGLSSAFNIVDFLTGRDLKYKSAVCYVLDTLFLDTVPLLCRMIKKQCSEPYVKIPLLAKTPAI